ncbi:MAG: acetyl-CoA carboxylase carboxyl transferase subunit alpha [Clostridia bacterium]|jgi:acetyl-CoA carboxylase carboxyl transferase alpha subunit|nr:acetyl-CoA carboxylase carboxyl transferase subunit alpha [Clostridia bacterium]MBT7122837.1 acetyl-CoA carboxylase carboxyl transferase subunit alpha [Clostridia bacterium]
MSSNEIDIKTNSPEAQPDHPWERVKSARKENRPQAQDYIAKLFHGVYEMKGDKVCGDDPSIITAIGWFESWSVTIIGQKKGHTLEERMKYNFGMPHPEGYRKSIRALKQAEKFGRPIICFVDTPGAYHGVEAEQRGQGLIIAEHLKAMATVKAPVISIIIGEGGSGGALALSLADRLIMLENSYFSVISPEGCASILFKDSSLAQTAAESLKLTSEDLKTFNIVDSVIKEPEGFNRFNMEKSVADVSKEIKTTLRRLTRIDPAKLVEKRHQKFLGMRGL